jgi:hypothetical protein
LSTVSRRQCRRKTWEPLRSFRDVIWSDLS